MPFGHVRRVLPLECFWENFELEKILCEGHRATVWRCRDRVTRRTYACKHYDLSSMHGDSKHMKRATNDLKVLLSLRGVASNVVQIEEAYGDNKSLFIVMELCAAGDLASHIHRKGPMLEDAAREVFLSVVLAVKQCHEHGVIHGSVAPNHVLLRKSPSAILHRSSCSVPSSPTSPFIAPPGVPIGPLLSRRLAKASTCVTTPSPGMPCLASASDNGSTCTRTSLNSRRDSPSNSSGSLRGASRAESDSSSCKGGRSSSRCWSSPVAKLSGLGAATQHETARAVAAALLAHGGARHHDVWGLGLVLRAMLSGHVSRWPEQESRRGGLGLDGVSEQARELIQRLMDDDVTKRPTLDDILHDPWLSCKSARYSPEEHFPLAPQSPGLSTWCKMGSREVDSRVSAVNLPPTRPVGGARASPSSAAGLPAGNDGSSGDGNKRYAGDARSNVPLATAAIPRSLRPIRVPSSSTAALPPVPPSSLTRTAMAAGESAEKTASNGGGADLDRRAGGFKIDGQNDGSHIRAGDAANLSFGRWCLGDAVEAGSRRSGCGSTESSSVHAGHWRGDDGASATATAHGAHGDGSHATHDAQGAVPCGARGSGAGGARGAGGANTDAAGGTREDGTRGDASEHAGAGGRGGMGAGPFADSTVDVGSGERRGGGRGAWQFVEGVTGDGVWPVEHDALWAAQGGCAHGGSARGSAEEREGERVSEKSSGNVWWVEKEMCGGGGWGGEVERRAWVNVGFRADASAEEHEYSLLCHSPRYAAYRHRRSSAQQVQASASAVLHEAQVRRFRSTLRFLGLDTSSHRWALLTWGTGVALLVVVPCCLYAYVQPADDLPQHQLPFQLLVLLLHNSLGAVAFLFLRAALRTHGLHAVLFLDSAAQEDEALQAQYLHALQALLFACIPLRTDPHLLPARYHVVQLALLFVLGSLSWLFAASTFLFTCVLFSKACSLQELKMQGYREVVQRCLDPALCFFEYTRISAGLAGISRRFRLFLLLTFSITLLGALASMFHMVLYRDGPTPLSFLNSGHLVVANVVALVGTGMCLRCASKLAHLHRRIVRVASAMHAQHTFDSAPLLPPTPSLSFPSAFPPPFARAPPAFLQRTAPSLSAVAPISIPPRHSSPPSSVPCSQPSLPASHPSFNLTTAPCADQVDQVYSGSPVQRPHSNSLAHSSTSSNNSNSDTISGRRITTDSCSSTAHTCPSTTRQHGLHPSSSKGLTEPLLRAPRVHHAATAPWPAQDPAVVASHGAAAAGEGRVHGMEGGQLGGKDGEMALTLELLQRQEAWAQRAALVNFLSSSAVGISVYGFVLDRVFIHTSVGALLTTTWFILGQSLSASFKPR
ncbi:unnamed protein product [Closterium sp. Yama58-4]|nr:unnamed protein product [Closterium sp. Yama58-4]